MKVSTKSSVGESCCFCNRSTSEYKKVYVLDCDNTGLRARMCGQCLSQLTEFVINEQEENWLPLYECDNCKAKVHRGGKRCCDKQRIGRQVGKAKFLTDSNFPSYEERLSKAVSETDSKWFHKSF